MTEHDGGSGRNNGNGGDAPDRLAAHERLSTGALARWYRACATHPRRVFLSWVGIVVVLIALLVTVGGSLKDEFDIPGSDTQKATDLIESEFASEQGGVLNLVFAAPPGPAARHPRAQGGDRGRDRGAQDLRVQADRGRGRDRERQRSVRPQHVLRRRADRLRGSPVRSGHLLEGSRGRRRRSGCGPRSGRSGRRHGRVQRRRRVPADRAGNRRSCSACWRR